MSEEPNETAENKDALDEHAEAEADEQESTAAHVQIEGEEASTEDDGEDADLPEDIKALAERASEYLDGWQRARAELANYKKRVERERQEAFDRAAADILTKFLEIMDDLDRAMEERPQDGDAAGWADGVGLVQRKLRTALDEFGVEPIGAAGQPFDPGVHEAISHEEVDGTKEGHVIDVLKQGYRMGERVLRPALVRVAK